MKFIEFLGTFYRAWIGFATGEVVVFMFMAFAIIVTIITENIFGMVMIWVVFFQRYLEKYIDYKIRKSRRGGKK